MDLRVRRAGAAGALAAVLLLAGCSADGERSSGSAAAADAKGPARTQGAPAAAPGSGGAAPGSAGATAGAGSGGTTAATTGTAAATDRQIAYQAKLTLRVDAVDDARTKAVDLVVRAGGYVAAENLRGGTGDTAQSTLTLKVPSAAYQATLDGLGGLGTRLGLSSQADDLTQQIADTDSRVKSMQASVDRVRALMADAKSLSEVVSLEGELTRRESDLESLQRQQQQLTARTSLSTVTLELVTRQPVHVEPKEEETGFWASVGHGLSNGWHALVTLVRVLLVALAAVAPFLVLLAPLGWLLRRRLRARRTGSPAVPPRPTHAPDTGGKDGAGDGA
ncbi:DUF4349 domain-containing protein [Kitasatospora sp. YST-16]|uniref:DUF4349 domain-containing protein n=1 Tax=Kitasatospora sp. YST-16 TaxID=2998080 RepID=UPI0022836C95|nr:DUF4349 domain-containing protein [Kitasatospora sp. YST-16]WAL74261.1 DUF4349 domain-containing protein [Kitasatospora sp. YST-16]WNW40328.1 DUF4349 domain-containing protein [Streptomyces sp. Li-HN-5-13]